MGRAMTLAGSTSAHPPPRTAGLGWAHCHGVEVDPSPEPSEAKTNYGQTSQKREASVGVFQSTNRFGGHGNMLNAWQASLLASNLAVTPARIVSIKCPTLICPSGR